MNKENSHKLMSFQSIQPSDLKKQTTTETTLSMYNKSIENDYDETTVFKVSTQRMIN